MTSARYDITVRGHLDQERWPHWFDGLQVALQPDGTTMLSGLVADQAALHGLLARVRDLGLVLIGVQRYESTQERNETR